jgi:hypothetical protein
MHMAYVPQSIEPGERVCLKDAGVDYDDAVPDE